MKKIIKTVDEKRGIIQVTTADERWYFKTVPGAKDGLPTFKVVPSVTWIAGHYPKGIAFYKWLASKGWDEAEAIKNAAGDKGSKVHYALSAILKGEEVRIDSQFENPSTGRLEELTFEEIDCIKAFVDWRESVKPEILAFDLVVFSDKYDYAGTIDLVCKIKEDVYLIDFKTGQYLWPEQELQISAYKSALSEAPGEIKMEGMKLAFLQLGYRRNKNAYKFTECDDQFDLFLTARKIWANETKGESVKQKDYPIVLSPAVEQVNK